MSFRASKGWRELASANEVTLRIVYAWEMDSYPNPGQHLRRIPNTFVYTGFIQETSRSFMISRLLGEWEDSYLALASVLSLVGWITELELHVIHLREHSFVQHQPCSQNPRSWNDPPKILRSLFGRLFWKSGCMAYGLLGSGLAAPANAGCDEL
jgi:hypothetical protein